VSYAPKPCAVSAIRLFDTASGLFGENCSWFGSNLQVATEAHRSAWKVPHHVNIRLLLEDLFPIFKDFVNIHLQNQISQKLPGSGFILTVYYTGSGSLRVTFNITECLDGCMQMYTWSTSIWTYGQQAAAVPTSFVPTIPSGIQFVPMIWGRNNLGKHSASSSLLQADARCR
jgi:hypothetical protein